MGLIRSAKTLLKRSRAQHEPAFPFFMPVARRELTEQEAATVERLLELAGRVSSPAHELHVVGRCGCGYCPTIFFQVSEHGDSESEVVTCAGTDSSGGLVAAVLLEKNDRLSQLEFYSADGHEPWSVPATDKLSVCRQPSGHAA